MAIYRNADAVTNLAERLDEVERGASTHWLEMHQTFEYRAGRLDGLKGFGGFIPRSSLLRRVGHRLMQRPYRQMAKSFAEFPRWDAMAAKLARSQGRIYDLDMLRQSITLAFLRDLLPDCMSPNSTLLVIGDGFGTLSSLALMAEPQLRVILVNLTKTLLVDLIFIQRGVPEATIALPTTAESMQLAIADGKVKVIAVRADDCMFVREAKIDLAVNIASMQEMNPAAIEDYFVAMRSRRESSGSDLYFYCCNREEKVFSDGTTVRFADYPWSRDDLVLADELCPWHQFYYALLPPRYLPYDGPIRHRLIKMAKCNSSVSVPIL